VYCKPDRQKKRNTEGTETEHRGHGETDVAS
jgi:hypothetical protein